MKNKMTFWLCLTFIFLASIGFSFAWFSTQIQGNDTAKTITTRTSVLKLIFDDSGDDVILSNIHPGDFIEKTITVENAGTEPTYYALNWVNLLNTFTNNDIVLSAECLSYSDYGNKSVSGSCDNIEKIVGYYETSGSEIIKQNISINIGITHEYKIKVEFKEKNENQNYNQGKNFSGIINIIESTAPLTVFDVMQRDNEIFADNVNSTYVQNVTPGIDFSRPASDTNGKGLYYTTDLSRTKDINNDGTGEIVYYYRGEVTNNNLLFAGFCWKIVRTNEDGSIRLRYNGRHSSISGCSSTSSIGDSPFNRTYGDNAYLGYMMGIDNNCTSGACNTSINTTSYSQATTNTYDSTIKKFIDEWYESKILTQGSAVTSKIANSIYCNDRKVATSDDGYTNPLNYTQYGYGNNSAEYAVWARLNILYKPQYKCELLNDEFSLSVANGGISGFGNNALKYPVALLNADEIVYSGNSKSFLKTSSLHWVLSPVANDGSGIKGHLFNSSFQYQILYFLREVYPSLSINGDTVVSNGTGIAENPYVIE